MDEPPYAPPHDVAVFSALYGFPGGDSAAEVPLALTAEEMKRVYDLVDRLKPQNAVRRKAEEFLTRSSTKLDSLHPILNALLKPNRVRRQERQAAVWILGSAELAGKHREFAIDTLIQVLEGRLEPDAADRARTLFWRALIASLLLAIPIADWENPYIPVALSVFIVLFSAAFAFQRIADRAAGNSVAAEAARALGKLRAVKGLDIVVAATQRVRGARGRKRVRLRNTAVAALPPILEAIRPDDEGRFRADTIQGLCRLLKTGDEPLVLAILQAFSHIGNDKALADVQRLASGEGRAAYESRVHRAAQKCLPLIQARVTRERDPHLLLRGSTVPPVPIDQLLRANPDAAPHDPFEMLRASSDPNWKGTEQEVNLVLQILQHMQERGDTRALPYVKEIAAAPGIDPRVQAAANACLPVLLAHQELNRYSPAPDTTLNVQRNTYGRD